MLEWIEKVKAYLKGVVVEMRKVTWTKGRVLLGSTGVVILLSLVAATIIWLFDLVFANGLGLILR